MKFADLLFLPICFIVINLGSVDRVDRLWHLFFLDMPVASGTLSGPGNVVCVDSSISSRALRNVDYGYQVVGNDL